MNRTGILFAAPLAALSALAGCGNSLEPEQAQSYCDRAREADQTCFTDAAYDSCVSCYEDCGVDCTRVTQGTATSCPAQFTCD